MTKETIKIYNKIKNYTVNQEEITRAQMNFTTEIWALSYKIDDVYCFYK